MSGSSGGSGGGASILHLLAGSQNVTAIEAARTILQNGGDANGVAAEGLTPLHVACSYDNLAMCQLLMAYGGDVHRADEHGRTPRAMAEGNTQRFLARLDTVDTRRRRGIMSIILGCYGRTRARDVEEREPGWLRRAGNRLRRSLQYMKRRGSHEQRGPVTEEESEAALRAHAAATPPAVNRQQSTATSGSDATFADPEPGYRPERRREIHTRGETGNVTRRRKQRLSWRGRGGRKASTPFVVSQQPLPVRQFDSRKLPPLPANCDEKGRVLGGYQTKTQRALPTAPPAETTPDVRRRGGGGGGRRSSGVGGADSTAYFTADDSMHDALNEIAGRLDELRLTPTRARGGKTPQKASPARCGGRAASRTPVARAVQRGRRGKSDEETAHSSSADSDADKENAHVNDVLSRRIAAMSESELRAELKKHGRAPGPMDKGNRRGYERKLYQAMVGENKQGVRFSAVLERAIGGKATAAEEARGRKTHDKLLSEWSDGGKVVAFCYLLLDPRGLPDNVDRWTFKQFVNAVFYVGKGCGQRPFQHLVEVKRIREGEIASPKTPSAKHSRIEEVWASGEGVAFVQFSQGVCDQVAFVIEASLIEAIGLGNLSNKKGGEWHGGSRDWTGAERAELGVEQLRRAWRVAQADGLRPIKHNHQLPAPFGGYKKTPK